MPISLEPIGPRHRLTAVAIGTVTLNDLKTFIGNARSKEQRLVPLFLDLSKAATDPQMPSYVKDSVNLLGEHTKQTGARARVAIYAPSHEVFGVLRRFMTYCEVVGVDHVAVFRARDEAAAWLDAGGRAQV